MKYLQRLFFSRKTMGVLLLVFAFSCAWATFIENDFGANTAKIKVYDALWFKTMLVLFAINILGLTTKHKLFQPGKLPVFLFHISFIIILIGAAVTDIWGYEGLMTIREGESSSTFLSKETYIQVKLSDKDINYKVHFAPNTRNTFHKTIHHNDISVSLKLTGYNTHKQGNTEFELIDLSVIYGNEIIPVKLIGMSGMFPQYQKIALGNDTLQLAYGSLLKELPFDIYLDDFVMDRYPGSNSPMGYKSEVIVKDKTENIEFPFDIYMNHILKYKGFRFFQSSYDQDEKGTILSVNKDLWGTWITYIGYIIMSLAMFLSLFASKSFFMNLARKKSLIAIAFMFFIGLGSVTANEKTEIPHEHVELFSEILIQDGNGRIKPMYTHASEVLRKVSRKTEIKGLEPTEWMISLYANPEKWFNEPFIKTKHKGIQEIVNSESKYISLAHLFNNNDLSSYKFAPYVNAAYQKAPAYRSKFDTEIIRADERVNLLLNTLNDANMRIFPSKIDSLGRWFTPYHTQGMFTEMDSVFASYVLNLYKTELQNSMKTGNWDKPNEIVQSILKFQHNAADYHLPSERKVNAEIFYYKSDIFKRISFYFFYIGFVLLILQFIHVFNSNVKIKTPETIAFILIAFLGLIHAGGLALRWYISGHAPWSNGYEALVFISWIMIVVGLLFGRKSGIVLSMASILTFLTLNTAHLSFMDPQVTNLVPVLNSFWLIIHVAIITASYAFLGIGALLAAFVLIVMFFESKDNKTRIDGIIDDLTRINHLILVIGLYMLTIGTFLGGVWANESWGRYWGWDPKETWALITILVYAFILHMRLIPGIKGNFAFNLMTLLGFGSVMMTYFGVNYYLSGLHSYASGDPLPIPSFIYYIVATIAVVAVLSYVNQKKIRP